MSERWSSGCLAAVRIRLGFAIVDTNPVMVMMKASIPRVKKKRCGGGTRLDFLGIHKSLLWKSCQRVVSILRQTGLLVLPDTIVFGRPEKKK